MNYIEICNELKIPITYLTTPIYGEFFFSVTIAYDFKHWRNMSDGKTTYSKNYAVERRERKLQYINNRDFLIKRIRDCLVDVPHEYRLGDCGVSIYFHNEVCATLALDRLSRFNIISSRCPRSEAHMLAMKDAPKVHFKNDLWFKKYQYRINLRIPFVNRNDINKSLVALFGGTVVKIKPWSRYSRNKCEIKTDQCRYLDNTVMYLASYDDVVMVKLVLGDYLVSYEVCEKIEGIA